VHYLSGIRLGDVKVTHNGLEVIYPLATRKNKRKMQISQCGWALKVVKKVIVTAINVCCNSTFETIYSKSSGEESMIWSQIGECNTAVSFEIATQSAFYKLGGDQSPGWFRRFERTMFFYSFLSS